MKKFINKLKAGLVAFGIVLISFSPKVFGDDWIEPNGDEYISAGQVLTGSSLLDIVSHRIHRILIIIIFAVGIISLCVVLKTKDKEKRKKRKKVGIFATFGAVLLLIVSDVIFWFIENMGPQTVYGVPKEVIGKQHGGKPIYPEDTVYSLPEPKASLVNVVVNLAQWIVPIITFIIGIVSFIRIFMTKDKELKKKRIRKTIVVLSVLIVLIIGISIAARFLNN